MSLILELEPETELELKQMAASTGIAPLAFAQQAIREKLSPYRPLPPQLTAKESHHLQNIDLKITEAEWKRYRTLQSRLSDEQISESEHVELMKLTYKIEDANVERITHLAALARLWHMDLTDVMKNSASFLLRSNEQEASLHQQSVARRRHRTGWRRLRVLPHSRRSLTRHFRD